MTAPVVLISGCSSGIGRALAEAFQAAGYRVFAGARKAADLQALQQLGCQAVKLDVNDPGDIARAAERLKGEAGRLDVLINNAGYGLMGPLLDCSEADLQQQFATNLFAPLALLRACLPLLRESRGQLLNISSVSAHFVTPFAGAYCASKAALHASSQALRMELAPFGIAVIEVQPGAIASAFGANASEQAERLIRPDSLWQACSGQIRARAAASQQHPTAADVLARQLLACVQSGRRPPLLRIGRGSTLLPLLACWLPTRWREALLKKRLGLAGAL